jgi:CRP-like cAMP-binding protein
VNPTEILLGMLRKFERRAPLEEGDREALLSLSFRQKTCEASTYLVREGAPSDECFLILEGLAYRHKITEDGGRQIVSLHIPGDMIDLEGTLLKRADYNAQTLTRCSVATIPTKHLIELVDTHPRVARAMWVDTLIDGSIYREWVMNVGRRPAMQRIGHLLCEFARRLEVAGLGNARGYQFPMTQEHLADATGLTPVHVNRTLKALEAEGLIKRERRFVHIPDWERLRDMSGFNELYLHLDQAA